MPSPAPLLLSLSLLALIISKGADIVTTVRGIRRVGGDVRWEQNPFARFFMKRFGLIGGMSMVMILWGLVVLLTYVPAYLGPPWFQFFTAFFGFFISWTQWQVAQYNLNGQTNFTSRLASSLYRRFQ